MYSLRVVTKLGNETEYFLGKNYQTFYRDRSDKETFEKYTDNVYMLIGSESGMVHSLLKNDANYIVNSNGDTYRNVTFKGQKEHVKSETKTNPLMDFTDEELINEMHNLYANAGIDREYEMFWIPAERNLRSAVGLEIPTDLHQHDEAQRKYIENFKTN